MNCWVCGAFIGERTQAPDDERRRARRYPVQVPVSGIFHGNTGIEFWGTSTNVSSRGLLVETEYLVKPTARRALVSIAWPVLLDRRALKLVLKAHLVWQHQQRLAFRFLRYEFRVLPLGKKAA